MTQEDFERLLQVNHEVASLEFKGAGAADDKNFFGLILKAAMRLSNKRDGGVIIIGVDWDRTNHQAVLSGLTEKSLKTWDYDYLTDQFAKFTSPTVNFTMQVMTYDGKKFVVLEIEEFSDIPVLCKKDYADTSGKTVIAEGTLYVKSFGKPESSTKLTENELRNLLQLATDKRLKSFVTQATAAGLSLVANNAPNAQQLFENELSGYNTPTLEEIRSRGYWKLLIRPSEFSKLRIQDIRQLSDIIIRSTVTTGGKDFPVIYTGNPKSILIGQDWVGQEINFSDMAILTDWRFYQSGQFVCYFGMRNDWHNPSGKIPPTQDTQSQQQTHYKKLDIQSVIFHFLEIFRFASNLLSTQVYDTDRTIEVDIEVNGLRGRLPDAPFNLKSYLNPYLFIPEYGIIDHLDTYNFSRIFERSNIIANPLDLAKDATNDLFARYNAKIGNNVFEYLYSDWNSY